jgi:hypothetical protein
VIDSPQALTPPALDVAGASALLRRMWQVLGPALLAPTTFTQARS